MAKRKPEVRWSPEALEDLGAIWNYYAKVAGPNTAEKIILELKEKMSGKGITIDAPELKDEADALEALVSLGYTQRDARDALANVSESNAGVENRVKAALKKLGKA